MLRATHSLQQLAHNVKSAASVTHLSPDADRRASCRERVSSPV